MKGKTMTTRIWTKKETQRVIKALREAGYHVPRKAKGAYRSLEKYVTEKGTERHVFIALDHGTGYLVTFHPDLFQGEA